MEGLKVLPLLVLSVLISQAACAIYTKRKDQAQQGLSPIVFIPGDAGSQLEARHHPVNSANFPDHCDKSSEWYRLWLNVWELAFGNKECFTETITLVFNETTGTSQNVPGVEVRAPGWGQTDTVEYIDPSWTAWILGNVGEYAASLVKELVSMGYVRGRSLRAAPYDFRYAPHSQTKLFTSLKDLIEDTYKINNDGKVTVMAHSMGGLFGLYFLRQQPQAWKDQYIERFVSLNTPWTGVMTLLRLYASGDTLGSSRLDPWVFRGEQRTQETNAYMLPHRGTTEYEWKDDEVLVVTPTRSYNISQLDQFMIDIGFPIGNAMRRQFANEDYELKDPGVTFHCVHASGAKVAGQFVYNKGWDVERVPTSSVLEDGDGTVNIRSLKGCAKVNLDSKAKDFHMTEIPNATHNGMLKDKRLFDFLRSVLK